MVQVSKNIVRKDIWEQVWKRLVVLVEKADKEERVEVLLDGVLTDTEKVMVAKRVMAQLLVLSDWPVGVVCTTLKMSRTTVMVYKNMLKHQPRYRELLTEQFGRVEYRIQKDSKLGFGDGAAKFLADMYVGYHKRSRLRY